MADAISVQVVERIKSLTHDQGRLRFSQVLALRDVEEKLAALTQSMVERNEIAQEERSDFIHRGDAVMSTS